MAGHRDAKWLKEQLSRVLGWDELIITGLVDAVIQAAGPGGNRSELEVMVENFLADSPAGIALINDFIALQQQPASSGPRAGGGGGSAAATTTTATKSYAASASAPSTSAAARATGQQQQQQQQHGRGQWHQQQQQQQRQQQSVSSKPAGPSAASHSWQALGGQQNKGAAAVAVAAATNAASAAVVDAHGDRGDDFSRFVVDDRTAGGGFGGRGGGGGSRSKPGSSRDLQALEAGVAGGADKPTSPGAGAAAAAGGSSSGGKVLGMFKAGGRIKAPAAKPVGVRAPDGGALALAASLERKVLNCLGCGKIYDCRSVTNDILKFLDRGGVCTFCGNNVPLSYKDRQKAAAAMEAESSSEPTGAPGAGGVEDAATVAARAFKDRLVEYDRNAAKRTTVIDDQSDFFEIDTNSWLTDQERSELRQRRQLEEEAAEARRRRLTVTIDLIGRKVVLDEDMRKAEEAAAMAAAERAAAAAKAVAAAEALRNTDGDGGGAYGSGGVFGGNAMLSAAAGAPTPEQLAAALESLRRMKATINPAVAATSAAPLFLPTAVQTTASGSAAGSKSGSGGGGARRYGPAAAAGGRGGGRAVAGSAAARGVKAGHHVGTARPGHLHERVQHDLGAELGFDAFGAEVALDELLGGALLAAAEEATYDICSAGMAPGAAGALLPTLQQQQQQQQRNPGGIPRAVEALPPGVVLLKGYLTMDEQIRIVHQIRELGIGPGGFYTPSYKTGARLWLHMMCMGLHWEPRTNSYETIRSSFDGATPPPIPSWLAELCGRCLEAASAAAVAAGGSRFPPLQPDICLANFYERSGKLGMHQDKDEMQDSLRAGLPVVSLSLGDAADFQYGMSRDVEAASTVRLESGDLLVFGGPGRMIFHAVAKVHSNTAPQELVRATGLRPGRLNLTFRQYKALTGGVGTGTGTGTG
ncbi:hypothetical protein Vafri_13915, partial [Volvox africanus]